MPEGFSAAEKRRQAQIRCEARKQLERTKGGFEERMLEHGSCMPFSAAPADIFRFQGQILFHGVSVGAHHTKRAT